MIKRLCAAFESITATVIGGLFLVASLVAGKLDINLPVDPAWVTVIISGIPLMYLALWRLIHNRGISKISSALLITIAMIAAIAIGDLFAAGEVAFIMAIGAMLEEMTTNRAKKGLEKLISLAPDCGRKISDGKEEVIPAEEICKGDILRILPGEAIPVDGIIVSGETSVDQSVVTGESIPVDKAVGDEVFCGTINRFGAVDIRATKVGEDSSLKKLIRMVQDAENKKAPMARVADKAASWLVPAALVIAVVAGFVSRDIVRAVTVLVVFCPCALVLATPTAIMAAIGQGAKYGVIIKSGEALEKMGKVDTIAFDKTGTLTYGKLEVCDIVSFGDVSREELLTLTASAEVKSEHPLARAVVEYAGEKGARLIESENFRIWAGKGVYTEISGKALLCGNERFLQENGIVLNDEAQNCSDELRNQGKALIYVAEGKECMGVIALSDILRADAQTVVSRLSDMNAEVVLLTGDNKKTAEYFARQAGIEAVHSELLPENKVDAIEKLMSRGKRVCMIGDGVNDAPALKTADVGVAMGSMGSDIAVEAADIALMSDDISRIPYLKRLANATVRTIKLSITLSMAINIAAVALSVADVLNPTTGALVHNAGSCFVVLIAALLYDRKFE